VNYFVGSGALGLSSRAALFLSIPCILDYGIPLMRSAGAPKEGTYRRAAPNTQCQFGNPDDRAASALHRGVDVSMSVTGAKWDSGDHGQLPGREIPERVSPPEA
jgi:hypothetical protein